MNGETQPTVREARHRARFLDAIDEAAEVVFVAIGCHELAAFLETIAPRRLRCAFEFRNETWFDPEVQALLVRHNAAFCIYDIAQRRSPLAATADFVYLRLHGPEAAAYAGSYGDAALAGWARRIEAWLAEGRDVYCYFDNDQKAYAAADALRLKEKLAAPGRAQRARRKTR